MQPATAAYLNDSVFGFAAVSIWASWSVITRLAVTTSLDAWDIVALRFGVAGLLLSPVLVQRGLARDRIGWLRLAVIIAGTGAPYALAAAVGLRFAPAYDCRSGDFPGRSRDHCFPASVWPCGCHPRRFGRRSLRALVPALSALLAIPLLEEWPNETDWVGIVLISAGVYLTSGGPLPGRSLQERHPYLQALSNSTR